ncbi:hypothetical protein CPB83DRAFT_92881 [Crepidotus variabilis]|uniref:Uncharacterized protein n=1 Tax=Crepidotus variabilis TaxID=179855 RepID=A0A9P6E522_9AGAR|nr:hypothetical protein CPB83DRAFT_92881 [Crepidotus variabilis]
MVSFPVPVGGIPRPVDFAPSILFAVLYGLLIPLEAYRLFHRRSRTILFIGTLLFGVERIAVFSLRAAHANGERSILSNGLIDYMQVSFALGSIAIATDLVNIVRCLLVNPTYGSARFHECPAAGTKECMMEPPIEGVHEDMPTQRFWIRRFTDFYGLAFLASNIPGSVANSHFHRAIHDQMKADNIYKLRIVSSGVCILLTIGLLASVAWGRRKLDRVSMRGVRVITTVVVLINVVSIYRLAVMPLRESSLADPIHTNTSGGKATFYLLHILPEWLASVILFSIDVRKTFGTGPFGDLRWRDETEEEKKKRLRRWGKKAAKKAAKRETLSGDIELIEKPERRLQCSSEQVLVEKKEHELLVREIPKSS